ncbi:hypothetical protein N7509_002071 [Penicillium cosmopolitanum]|uniref:Thiamine pyrophosphokinase n=1 Tax=Penicillium cosmopolitanum TaxID=1131564 RepID=A0A9W9W8H3_9EURO|nr:uncharacterized protein N7509_002071 [Penicillium cosmopolitanum]KAJ5408188.1 hypothetical protein N7509_002071 [Penicillium cosmopolitanum]
MEWDPSQFFRPGAHASPYALLVLNQPINETAFGVLSEHASYIICADGGANRLYDMLKHHGKESTVLPDRIMGDLDSLKPAVKEHYEKLDVPINKDPDQYSTDFTKCLKYLNEHASEIIASPRKQAKTPSLNANSTLEMVILGGLGGRVDQAFSQIHHLYMMTQTQRELRESQQDSSQDKEINTSSNSSSKPNQASGGNLYLVSEESITFVLQKGKNIIHTPATKRPQVDIQQSECDDALESRKRKRVQNQDQDQGSATETDSADDSPEYLFEENIGIIPLSAPASITTHGFEWDVEDWHTEIGGQLSTSNHIRADVVSVETSVPVLFTVELAERLKR